MAISDSCSYPTNEVEMFKLHKFGSDEVPFIDLRTNRTRPKKVSNGTIPIIKFSHCLEPLSNQLGWVFSDK